MKIFNFTFEIVKGILEKQPFRIIHRLELTSILYKLRQVLLALFWEMKNIEKKVETDKPEIDDSVEYIL